MEQRAITQEEKTRKEIRAEEQVKRVHENIGNMRYDVELHFAEKGDQTVKDKLKRVILHEANPNFLKVVILVNTARKYLKSRLYIYRNRGRK